MSSGAPLCWIFLSCSIKGLPVQPLHSRRGHRGIELSQLLADDVLLIAQRDRILLLTVALERSLAGTHFLRSSASRCVSDSKAARLPWRRDSRF